MGFDDQIRVVAFKRAARLTHIYGDDIPWEAITQGLDLSGERILLANRARGIFKPRQMQRGALSIKTTRPREGRVNIYADAEEAEGVFVYSLQGSDPNSHDNRALHECMEDRLPLIYFYAVAEGIYKAIFPCFIDSIDAQTMTCRVSVELELPVARGDYIRDIVTERIERRYAFRETKIRLHQAEFRERVISAYSTRCAMSSLPVHQLLEAAPIVPDAHECGYAEVSNGICLSRIHHRAFDANLIGVTPDYEIQVSERLLDMQDGPVLEGGIKALHGQSLMLPKLKIDWPSRERLERRFYEFKNWSPGMK